MTTLHSKKTTLDEKQSLSQLTSQEIFQGSKLIQILHAGQVYQLRITRQGKLILTK